ncbi:MAG TPA: fatty acid desaturase [Methylomirabilota bacterium]|nr:fatty acid desaturase [Methylomirabilota bacterium]
MSRIRWTLLNWPNSLFLVGTLFIALAGVPLYVWFYGLDWFQVALFFLFFIATGLSITLGYHRLFSHLSFKARWPVRLMTLIFGAAAFENSVLAWAADHRRHHKCVDHDEDPYNISKGFFHAHIGWMLFDVSAPSLEGVKDLLQDPLVRWQHRYYLAIAIIVGFVLPTALGFLWGGWVAALGAFLIAGVARVVFVNHMTFFINSWSHSWGRRPYSSRCSARDNGLLAWLTFGEGYHNFHHAFQHDYRNGVKPWHFDPTKWCIWLLARVGLASQLRRVPGEAILLAEIAERQKHLATLAESGFVPASGFAQRLLQGAQERLQHASVHWEQCKSAYRRAAEAKMDTSRHKLAEMQRECHEATDRLRVAIHDWWTAYRVARLQMG